MARRRGNVREKRPDAWYWQASTPDPAAPEGRRRLTGGPFTSRREAERALTAALVRIDTGTLSTGARSSTTLLDYCRSAWLPDVAARRKPTTHDFYRGLVDQYLDGSKLGAKRMASIRPIDVAAWLTEVRSAKTRRGQPVSESTVSAAWRTVRAALRHGADNGVLAVVPMPSASVRPVQGPGRANVDLWTADALRAWTRKVDEHEHGLGLRLALSTGLRRGELVGLRWSDVDLDAATITVTRALVEASGTVVESTPKTARSRRRVDLDADITARLQEHRLHQREDALAHGLAWSPSWSVLAHVDGRPIHPDALTLAMREVCADAGVPPRRLHDLRHLHASLALAAGVDIFLVSRRLGHSSIAETADVYGHVEAEAGRAAAEAFGRHLAARLGG